MRRLFTAIVAIVGVACGGGQVASTSGGLTTRNADVITAGELSRTEGLMNAWDAVLRLRPRFLRNSGPTSLTGGLDNRAIVRIDETVAGPPEALRTVDVQYVLEIRYYNATDATARFGGTYGRAVIHVVTRSSRRP
ncbi:MAG: hypothetical protein U0163_09160 [Gemmatimonadaceae bacterium]